MNRNYELAYIADPELDEEALSSLVELGGGGMGQQYLKAVAC